MRKNMRMHFFRIHVHKIRSDENTPKIWETPNQVIGEKVTAENVTICVFPKSCPDKNGP